MGRKFIKNNKLFAIILIICVLLIIKRMWIKISKLNITYTMVIYAIPVCIFLYWFAPSSLSSGFDGGD